jgi:inner membrane protein
MDPVTHGFAGATLRYLGFEGRAALPVLVFSAVFPDMDYFTLLWGQEAFFRYHRGITHGIGALVLVPALVASVTAYLKMGFIYYYALSFIGLASHMAMDLTNMYGIRLFSPLDDQFYYLDLVFAIDPYISAALFFCVLYAVWHGRGKGKKTRGGRARIVAFATVLFVVCYVGVRSLVYDTTKEFLRKNLNEYVIKTVTPLPNDLLRWWFVADGKEDIKVGYADLFTGSIYIHDTFSLTSYDPYVWGTRRVDLVRDFLRFARNPHAEIRREGDAFVITWRELSYTYIRGEHFIARVVLGGDGKIREKYFRF